MNPMSLAEVRRAREALRAAEADWLFAESLVPDLVRRMESADARAEESARRARLYARFPRERERSGVGLQAARDVFATIAARVDLWEALARIAALRTRAEAARAAHDALLAPAAPAGAGDGSGRCG